MAARVSSALVSVDFEIFGKVQGVFFRKNTKKTADLYGLVGWVRNTDRDTVEGQVQGQNDRIKQMKIWLQTKGSRRSEISRADFKNEKSVEKLDYKEFKIIR
ncbi:acylphosphatase-1-like [Acanthaster planci]|uniref:acylphosphatase n=1 Tax=Acanthaster planci TaxID=133434 RepID=A0A8B7ZKC5_ACAPL|nr:acylphosphatase-1-like [Acanthaster planci]